MELWKYENDEIFYLNLQKKDTDRIFNLDLKVSPDA